MNAASATPSFRIGEGPPLLLLHPFATSWRAWQPVAQILKSEFDIFAPTLPGHFGGPPATKAHPATTLVDSVERMMDGLGWDKAHIAGNSLGGWIALDLARRGRATTVTAFAPAGGWRKNTVPAFLLGLSFLPWYPIARLPRSWAIWLMAAPARRRIVLRWVMEHADRVSADDALHFADSLRGCSIYLDVLRDAISSDGIEGMYEVTCPVHLVFSEHDHVVPMKPFGTRFLAELPHATNEVIAGAGHVPMLESPDRVAAILRRHARVALELSDPPAMRVV
jgi:pimeloyl-ACP methyl ester carboxylesterase